MQGSSSSLKKRVEPTKCTEFLYPIVINDTVCFSGHDFCKAVGIAYSTLGDLMNTTDPLRRIECVRFAGKAYIPVEEIKKFYIRQALKATKLFGVFNDTTTATSGKSVPEA